MRFKAFGYKIDWIQDKLIRKMIAHLTEDEVDIIDLRCFEADTSTHDIVFTYGKKAKTKLANAECLLKVEFPEAYKLDATLGDDAERKLAMQKLAQLKKTLDSGDIESISNIKENPKTETTQQLTVEKLPSQLTATSVKELEKQQILQGKTCWLGSTIDGKSIRVTVEPEESDANIQMTFAELYAVIGLKEAFRVKELEFVYKPSNATK